MQVTAITLVSLLFLSIHRGSRAFLDSNPALGAYQDDGKCFPMKESWYIAYRNFENDPYFGGTSKCAKATEITPYVHNSSIVVLEYGKTLQYTKVSLASGCGYNAQNSAKVAVFGQFHSKFSMTAAYIDCNNCKLFRNSYALGGNGCTLWKPESKINQENRCCDFVFALLCGGSAKYQIYDNCH
uniref:Putative lipocal-1 1 n=1 Tax=Amblyomma triste TaxID=251400 RepID=A0A023GDK5_AMBTT